jgi:hypothetical protein
MHQLDKIIEKNHWLLVLWGLVLAFGLVITIVMMAEMLFPE